MTTVFILSYNSLGLDFWKNHLELSGSDRVSQFRSGQDCVKSLNHEPSLIIIDDYFANSPEDDAGSEEVIQIINEIMPDVKVFHISPRNCGSEMTHGHMKFVCSNFNQDVITDINETLNSKRIIAA
mgnify:CR=1 FL=1|tara:strand:+ start:215 stop:592 length:378 start_codon:yes stop_codon:yes gene_type:complete